MDANRRWCCLGCGAFDGAGTVVVVVLPVFVSLSHIHAHTHHCLPQQTAQTSPIPIMAGSTLNASTMLVYTEFPEPVSSVLYSSVSKGGSGGRGYSLSTVVVFVACCGSPPQCSGRARCVLLATSACNPTAVSTTQWCHRCEAIGQRGMAAKHATADVFSHLGTLLGYVWFRWLVTAYVPVQHVMGQCMSCHKAVCT